MQTTIKDYKKDILQKVATNVANDWDISEYIETINDVLEELFENR